MTFFDSDDDGLSDISETDLFDALDSAREKCLSRGVKTQPQPARPPPIQAMPPPRAQPLRKRSPPSFLPRSRDVNQAHFNNKSESRDLNLPLPGSLPWTAKYQPKNASEIAISPKKYTEIYNTILESVTSAVGRVVILSGPAGSSKSTALNQAIIDVSKLLNKSPLRLNGVTQLISTKHHQLRHSTKLFRSTCFFVRTTVCVLFLWRISLISCMKVPGCGFDGLWRST